LFTYIILFLGRQLVLDTLHALMSNTKVVKEAMAKGIILFDIFFVLNPEMSSLTNPKRNIISISNQQQKPAGTERQNDLVIKLI